MCVQDRPVESGDTVLPDTQTQSIATCHIKAGFVAFPASSGGCGILSFQRRFLSEIRVELRNFVFSAQNLISGSPNRGRGVRVIVIKTLHHVNSFPDLKK